MSIYSKDLFGRSKYKQAIERIKFHCAEKRTVVAFSGGKDSQCCYHLCKDAGIDFTAQYSITRFEPPELITFIHNEYPNVTFRRAYKESLVKEIERRGMPNRYVRWCCKAKHCKIEDADIVVIGVRAEESARRAENWRHFGRKQDGSAYICPIFDWTEENVWEYLNGIGAKHCSLYDEGYSRIGCVMCPLTMKNRKQEVVRYPKFVAMLKVGAQKFVQRMRSLGFITKSGKRCAEWCLSQSPEDEYWTRWVETCQTQKSVAEMNGQIDHPDQCLFEGSGFSEKDNNKEETE